MPDKYEFDTISNQSPGLATPGPETPCLETPGPATAGPATAGPATPDITSRKMGWKIFGFVMSAIFVVVALSISAVTWSGHSSRTDAAPTPQMIDTPYGRYVGSVSTAFGKSSISYKSIPFAKPPVGALRFKRPQPLAESYGSHILNSDMKPSCWSVTRPSTDPNFSEDCLYLNVYTPLVEATQGATNSFPVMVWIHGGGFVAGSAFPEPTKMVARSNVIVVTVNYRLGVFGFLTTKDDDLPANNGLWDQYLALKWVKENIHHFEGNASAITVFGESAGAISTALLAVSPMSAGLFQKAILQSGSLTSPLSRDSIKRAREFAEKVGCASRADGNTSDLGACLRQLSIADILNNSLPFGFNITAARKQADFIWQPTVDGEFIPDEPMALLANHSYLLQVGALKKDYMIGLLNNEGALLTTNFLKPIPLQDTLNATLFTDLLDYFLYTRYGLLPNENARMQKEVHTFYSGSPESSLTPQNILDAFADLFFIVPAVETALALSSCSALSLHYTPPVNSTAPLSCPSVKSNIYFYLFDYCAPSSDLLKPPCMKHGDDVAYEFPKNTLADPVENKLSDTFIDILTTFAATSEPGSALTSEWPSFEPSLQRYLRLDTVQSIRRYPFDYRVSFWLKTIPYLMKNR
ncbi:unnamed protein product [Lymnaea stagnalis]|uniref:Carboxylesterase type B domain-containing protein n=1 Tax=Lymnaea stagnalis TaxID=6523 RepID=A0AAV2HUD9_LYMST